MFWCFWIFCFWVFFVPFAAAFVQFGMVFVVAFVGGFAWLWVCSLVCGGFFLSLAVGVVVFVSVGHQSAAVLRVVSVDSGFLVVAVGCFIFCPPFLTAVAGILIFTCSCVGGAAVLSVGNGFFQR